MNESFNKKTNLFGLIIYNRYIRMIKKELQICFVALLV